MKMQNDELIDQYLKERNRFELFFDWYRNLSLLYRMGFTFISIFGAFLLGNLVGTLIRTWG